MKADLKSGSTLRLGWLAVLLRYLSKAALRFSTNSETQTSFEISIILSAKVLSQYVWGGLLINIFSIQYFGTKARNLNKEVNGQWTRCKSYKVQSSF